MDVLPKKNIDDRSHRGYFMGYAATTGVVLYWKPNQPFIIHRAHYVWFDEYNSRLSVTTNTLQVPYSFGKILRFVFIIQTSSTWYHMNLILNIRNLVMKQLSRMILSYLPLERKLVLIYWIMNILQSLTSLIPY